MVLTKTRVLLPFIGAIILAGCTHTTPPNSPSPMPTNPTSNNQSDVLYDDTSSVSGGIMPAPEVYTLDQVAAHNTAPGDCWLVIEGNVYNVSNFAQSGHPGGEAVYQGCGTDATQLFNFRPMGSGTPHSDQARSFLPNFLIGTISQE